MNEVQSITKAVAYQEDDIGLSVAQVIAQSQKVIEVMRSVMKEDVHYGTIPGCPKPCLYKPGAEKLGLTFRLSPRFEIIEVDLGNGHRKYDVVCRLTTIGSERFISEGVGSCSTMEGKYRFRSESTGQEVPKEYWKHRDSALLGGHEFSPKKLDGQWVIVHRVEHDNPADYYNTCAKMAAKRAHVAAILLATAASDVFTQDVEDYDEPEQAAAVAPEPTIKAPERKAVPPEQKSGNGKPVPPPIPNDKIRYIRAVKVEEGEKNGKPWTRFDVYFEGDSNKYSTFVFNLGQTAEDAESKGLGVVVDVKSTQSGKYTNWTLEHIEIVPNSVRPQKEVPATEEAIF